MKKILTFTFCLFMFLISNNTYAQTCGCTNCPQTLPDGANEDFFVNVSGADANTLGVDNSITSVVVAFDHAFLGDLTITLTAPSGQTVTLVGTTCGSASNCESSVNGTFTFLPNSSGATQWSNTNSASIVTGNFTPYIGDLATTTGDVNGTWTINVSDDQATDSGNFADFQINFADNTSSTTGTGFIGCDSSVPPTTCSTAVFPSGYGNSLTAEQIIEVCPDNAGESVTIAFTAGTVETTWDDMNVYSGAQGTGTGGSALATGVDGSLIGNSYTGATDECVSIYMDSDGGLSYSNWAGTITCTAPVAACIDCATANCGVETTIFADEAAQGAIDPFAVGCTPAGQDVRTSPTTFERFCSEFTTPAVLTTNFVSFNGSRVESPNGCATFLGLEAYSSCGALTPVAGTTAGGGILNVYEVAPNTTYEFCFAYDAATCTSIGNTCMQVFYVPAPAATCADCIETACNTNPVQTDFGTSETNFGGDCWDAAIGATSTQGDIVTADVAGTQTVCTDFDASSFANFIGFDQCISFIDQNGTANFQNTAFSFSTDIYQEVGGACVPLVPTNTNTYGLPEFDNNVTAGTTPGDLGSFDPALPITLCYTYTSDGTGAASDDDVEGNIPVGYGCTAVSTITAGTPSACNTGDNTYTVDITVTIPSLPAAGGTTADREVDINGQKFTMTSTTETFTLTGLTADATSVDVTAFMSVSTGCITTSSALFTAPASCACSASSTMTWD